MAPRTFIDGTEVTSIVQEGTSSHLLNKVWTATCKIPIDEAVEGIGKRLRIEDVTAAGVIDHHGTIKHESDDDGEDGDGYTEYTSYDPREFWEWRPARDPDGDYSKPTFLEDNITGPQIVEAILDASENAGAGPPADAEGDLFLAFGGFAGGGANLSGIPVDWPMTIEEIVGLLCDTGRLDVILTPINAGGNMAQVDCYNGNFGTDLSGSVTFEYAMGAKTIRRLRRTRDMSKMANKIRYLLGPKCDDQHWRRSIEATNMDLPDDAETPIAAVQALIAASRVTFGVRSDIRIYDALFTGSCLSDTAAPVPLHQRLWVMESILRAQYRTLVHATPVRGITPTFDVGDLIGIDAGAAFRGGISGVQRVYGRKVAWDVDGVVELSEITSSDDGDAV